MDSIGGGGGGGAGADTNIIPSDITFDQRRGWADTTSWADNT